MSGQDLGFVAGSLLLIASGRHGRKAGISLEPVASSVTYQNLPLCLSEISDSCSSRGEGTFWSIPSPDEWPLLQKDLAP